MKTLQKLKLKYLPRIIPWGLTLILFLGVHRLSYSQIHTNSKDKVITYQEYLNLVVTKNLDYSAEQFNVHIADAQIEAAKVFQNPALALDWEGDQNEFVISTTLSKTFELGQKREARINLAQSERLMTKALLNDYFRNLQADATLDFVYALEQNYLYEIVLNSYQTMKELADADSVRLKLGSIRAIDAAQSKIEAGVLRNQLLQLEADRKNAFITLSMKMSRFKPDTLFSPKGRLVKVDKDFNLNDLLTNALNNRTDLLAAKSNVKYSEDRLNLTVKERIIDVDLNIGTITSGSNRGTSIPYANQLYTGLAIPLKFSNLNKGEIQMAKFQIEQADLLYRQVEIAIQNEVLQAYNQYKSTCAQVDNYDEGLLELAKTVLAGKVYSYTRGESSLLEVLNAQRTYNDLQTSYYETLFNSYAALIDLERAAGIWDIEL